MKQEIPTPVAILIVVIVLLLVVGIGVWWVNREPAAPSEGKGQPAMAQPVVPPQIGGSGRPGGGGQSGTTPEATQVQPL